MLDTLPESKDIYSARCLAHHLYGKPYHTLERSEINRAVQQLKDMGVPYLVVYGMHWPGAGEVFSNLYVVRNLDKYRNNRTAVLDHLYELDPPPKAVRRTRKNKRTVLHGVM